MAKKDNTVLWIAGLLGVGAVAYFGFIKPKQKTQLALPGTTSATADEAARLRAQAALVTAQAEAQGEWWEKSASEAFAAIPGVFTGIWGG